MLNKELLKCKHKDIKTIDTSSFSISMNGTEARLHVSWKEGQTFNVQKIRSFALQESQQFLEFRKYVLNISDWGRNERLESIKSGLDLLPEEGLKAQRKNTRAPITKSKSTEVLGRQKPCYSVNCW
jgi:hypothetical protein